MQPWTKRTPFLMHLVSNLRGGSQPILAQASDGLLYVVKFANNPQGPNLAFNESMGCALYRACGLPSPSWKPLIVTDSFLENNRSSWMHTEEGILRPALGLCLGSAFLGGRDTRLIEFLPKNKFQQVRNRSDFWTAWLVDICASHADHRQAMFVENADGLLDAHFVDHGHMFHGTKGDSNLNFKASRYLDSRIYHPLSSREVADMRKIPQQLDTGRIWQSIDSLPSQWVNPSALCSLRECLDRLSTRELLRNVLDTIVDSCERMAEFESGHRQRRRKSPASVLYSGIQRSGRRSSCVDGSACA